MDSPANHRSPWAKLCHYRFSISFRRFFFPFSFSSFFFLLPSPPFPSSRVEVHRSFLLSFPVFFFFPLLGHSFILSCFSYFLPSLCLSPCQSVSIGSPRAISRKVLPEVRRFYYRFASLTRRPIFYKKKKEKTILQQDFDDATIHIFLQYYIFR